MDNEERRKRYTAVNVTWEARADLDMINVRLAAQAGRRLNLSETITEARKALDTSAVRSPLVLRELVRRMDLANGLEDLGERGVAMSHAWADLGEFLSSGVSELPPEH